MRRPWGILAGAALLLLAAWVFPPVRFHRLRARRAPAAGFQAAAFAEAFWRERLLPAADRAAPAREVLAALRSDPVAAGQRYGRTVGEGGTLYFFIRGAGRVVGSGKDGTSVSLSEGGADLLIPSHFVFGNALRDATGLLDPSAFANSQDFNAVAAELNHLAETRVLAPVRNQARAGRALRFAAVAEVDPDDGPVKVLKIVPVEVAFE